MNKIKQYLISIDGSTTNTGIAVFDYNTKELIDYTYIKPDNPYDIINNMNKAQIKNNPTFLYKAPKLLQDQKTAKKNCNNNIIDINITHNDDCNYELE